MDALAKVGRRGFAVGGVLLGLALLVGFSAIAVFVINLEPIGLKKELVSVAKEVSAASFQLEGSDLAEIEKSANLSVLASGDMFAKAEFGEGNAGFVSASYLKDLVSSKNRSEIGEFLDGKETLLRSAFLPVASPYPGAITRESFCSEKTKPKRVASNVSNSRIFLVGAGVRRNYGVCLEEDIIYNSTYFIWYCENTNAIFEAKVFFKGPYKKENLGEIDFSSLCPKKS